MSAAFRAGLTLAQAMENIAQEMPAPLSQEFSLFVKEIKLGVSQEEALQNMAERVGSKDLQLVVTATNVAKQLGGNMAEMYDIIASHHPRALPPGGADPLADRPGQDPGLGRGRRCP